MSDAAVADRLTRGIRAVAALADDAEGEVEKYLEEELGSFSTDDRLQHLLAVARQLGMDSSCDTFAPQQPASPPAVAREGTGQIRDMLSRFLGKGAETGDLSEAELTGKFAASLDTMFDTLNQIVSVINVTLMGRSPELETIRKVIRSNLHGDTDYLSIRDYLERIRKSFLVAHDSFQDAASQLMHEVLAELDPEVQGKVSRLKFGPLRKAELFDNYAEKHERCKKWLASGQHKERLLREFEKQCQQRFR